MRTIDEELQEVLEAADKIIIDEVVRLATVVLKENKQAKEFIMAMGSFFFTLKSTKNPHFNFSTEKEIKALNGGRELWDFIYKWDSQFKVTGEPIRFCLNGKIKTDW